MKKAVFSRCRHCGWLQKTASRKQVRCHRCGKLYKFNRVVDIGNRDRRTGFMSFEVEDYEE